MKQLLPVGFVFFALNAAAIPEVNVTIHNGNVYFSETDLPASPSGAKIDITRNYNSRSLYDGMFGFGWSSRLETFFQMTPEGNILIHEAGGGDKTLMVRDDFKPTQLDTAIDTIITKMKEAPKNKGKNDAFWVQRREVLKNDAEVRILTAKDVGVKFQLGAPGKYVWKSTQRGLQEMRYSKTGWVRIRRSVGEENFDLNGRLTRIREANFNVAIARDAKGRIESLKAGTTLLTFDYGQTGKVTSIKWGSKVLAYTYKNVPQATLLMGVKRFSGEQISYDYTSGMYVGDYNARLIQSGKDKVTLAYDLKEDTVTQIADLDGTVRNFTYTKDVTNPNDRYGVSVKYSKDGKQLTEARFSYWWKDKSDGSRYIYQTEKTENNETVRTVYNSCCGLPLEIVKNGKTTKFEYTQEGLLTSKVTPDGTKTMLEYNMKFSKVSKVTQVLPNVAAPQIVDYGYDNSGNLVNARSSDGKNVKLFYDKQMRISKIIDKAYGEVSLAYNEQGRPNRIVQGKGGKQERIDVTYKDNGEIADVRSPAGAKMAYQVTNAFYSLLNLISPAGVPLTAE